MMAGRVEMVDLEHIGNDREEELAEVEQGNIRDRVK